MAIVERVADGLAGGGQSRNASELIKNEFAKIVLLGIVLFVKYVAISF